MVAEAVSADTLLGGRVVLQQPAAGFRVAIDPVFLAAAVPAGDGDLVLDVGTGTGAAALCLASRLPGARVFGIDVDSDLIHLATDNARASGLSVEFMTADLKEPPARLAAGSFNHVMANPPFMEANHGNPPPDAGRRTATVEGASTLADWLDFCLLMVRPRARFTFIHRADRLDSVLATLGGRLGEIVVFPLWPGPAGDRGAGEKPAKRIILSGRKGINTPMKLVPGLVLHGPGGVYTPEAEEVLRHGKALRLAGEAPESGNR